MDLKVAPRFLVFPVLTPEENRSGAGILSAEFYFCYPVSSVKVVKGILPRPKYDLKELFLLAIRRYLTVGFASIL